MINKRNCPHWWIWKVVPMSQQTYTTSWVCERCFVTEAEYRKNTGKKRKNQ